MLMPHEGEKESEFMKRCVPMMMGEGMENDQAVAVCMAKFKEVPAKMTSDFILDEFVSVRPGQPYRLLKIGRLVKDGKERIITSELLSKFRLPHFKPAIKTGSHAEETPAGGHILAL